MPCLVAFRVGSFAFSAWHLSFHIMRPFCGKQKYLLPYARYCCISPVVLVAVPVAGGNRNLLQLILIALPVISISISIFHTQFE